MRANVIRQIRRELPDGCFVTSYHSRKKYGGHRLSVKVNPQKFASWVLIDMDENELKSQLEGNRCDCLFCAQEKDSDVTWVVPVEVKGRQLPASHIIEQLCGGLQLLDRFQGWGKLVQFHPAVVHPPGVDPRELDKIGRQWKSVKFLELSSPIVFARYELELPGKRAKLPPQTRK